MQNLLSLNIMKKIFYILLCTMFVSSCKEHILSNYGIEFHDKECKIYLDKDKNYTISVEGQESQDMIFVMFLSYGKYERHNNNLLLYDDEGFEMSFKIKENRLSPKESFAFMKGNEMESRYIHPDEAYLYRYDSAHLERKAQIINDFENSSIGGTFKCGTYNHNGGRSSIKINEDGTYQFIYKDLLLSKGKWEIEDNILYLYDLDLSYRHEIIINGKTLIIKKSFGDFESYKFEFYE